MVLRNMRYSKLDISLLSHLAVMADFLNSCWGEASDMDLWRVEQRGPDDSMLVFMGVTYRDMRRLLSKLFALEAIGTVYYTTRETFLVKP